MRRMVMAMGGSFLSLSLINRANLIPLEPKSHVNMNAKIDKYSWSIVLIGNFNPSIFQPAALYNSDVIGKEESKSAEIEIIHQDIAILKIGYIRITVEKEKFNISTQVVPEQKIFDITQKIFLDMLPHTPIRAVGINTDAFFDACDESARIQFGRDLAPTVPWGKFGERILQSTGDTVGGLTRLEMRDIIKEPNWDGWVQSSIRPDNTENSRNRIALNVNCHFKIDNSERHGALEAMDTLARNYERSKEIAKDIVQTMAEAVQ